MASPPTSSTNTPGRIDPVESSAPPAGWRRWATDLAHSGKEQIAAFGVTLVVGLALGVLSLYLFTTLASIVAAEETFHVDMAVLTWLRQAASPPMDSLMTRISRLGSEMLWFVVAGVGALLIWRRRFGAAAMLVLVVVGAQLLNTELKDIYQRERPLPWADTLSPQQWSFPSGHAMVSAAFYSFLAYLAWRILDGRWRGLVVGGLVTLVLAIGVSRMYLQAHYLSDVVAGYVAGILWTDAVIISAHFLERRWRHWYRPRPTAAAGPPQVR